MEQALEAALRAHAVAQGCALELTPIWHADPVMFDPACLDLLRSEAAALGLRARDMVSGAGHDAAHVARVAPTAMIFVPCLGGLSHNEAESITPAQAADGANLLLHAVLARDRIDP
jgi:N-carbamoyl-L-amino-acid hydrolase